MEIFIYPSNFVIKSKLDAKRFLNLSKGCFYWNAGYTDYCLENGNVSFRSAADRGNVFAPYIELTENEALATVWKTRKQINEKLKG